LRNNALNTGKDSVQSVSGNIQILEVSGSMRRFDTLGIAREASENLVLISEGFNHIVWPKDANDYANALSLNWADSQVYCQNLVFCYEGGTSGFWNGSLTSRGTCNTKYALENWRLATFNTENEATPKGEWVDILNSITWNGVSYSIQSPSIPDSRFLNYNGEYWTGSENPLNPLRAWRLRLSHDSIFSSAKESTFSPLCVLPSTSFDLETTLDSYYVYFRLSPGSSSLNMNNVIAKGYANDFFFEKSLNSSISCQDVTSDSGFSFEIVSSNEESIILKQGQIGKLCFQIGGGLSTQEPIHISLLSNSGILGSVNLRTSNVFSSKNILIFP
ncbi:MAG: hypothetical protein ACMXYK_01610, partial [Candidatus Woesearchaeota archaeon]